MGKLIKYKDAGLHWKTEKKQPLSSWINQSIVCKNTRDIDLSSYQPTTRHNESDGGGDLWSETRNKLKHHLKQKSRMIHRQKKPRYKQNGQLLYIYIRHWHQQPQSDLVPLLFDRTNHVGSELFKSYFVIQVSYFRLDLWIQPSTFLWNSTQLFTSL